MSKNKFIAIFILVIMVLGVCCSGTIYSMADSTKVISYNATLEVKDSDNYQAIWTDHPDYLLENLNDGDTSTIVQPIYKSLNGGEVYNADGILKESFYIVLDMEKVYALESIAVCWYPNGGRAYKYNVESSVDYITWTKLADHSTNVTEKDTITDSLNDQEARFIRLEIFGNYRESDNTRSNYFPTSEITLKGELSEQQPEATPNIPTTELTGIEYDVELESEYAFWTGAFPVENISDGNYSNCVQVETTGWFDAETGILDEPFYLSIDLYAVYDLSQIRLDWMLKNDKYYMYNIYTSIDGDEYVLSVDHSKNTASGTITDELTDLSARYITIEVLGNYIPSEQTSNSYFALHELSIQGKISENQPTRAPAATPGIEPTAVTTPSPVPTEAPTATPVADDSERNEGPLDLWIILVIIAVAVIGIAIVVTVIIKKKSTKK